MTANPVASRRFVEILLITSAILFFNWMQHFPPLVQSTFAYANTDVLIEYWRQGIGQGAHLIPYVQFPFEYPAVVGFFVYLTSGLARTITCGSSSCSSNSSDFFVALDYYVFFMDIVLAAFTIGTVYYVYKICDAVRKDTARIWKAFLVAPTFLLYPFFNWDMIAIFFTVLAVWYTIHKKSHYAAASLGLGIATKLYPAIILPVVMAEEKSWKARLKVFCIAALVFGLLNAPLMALNFSGWLRTWTFDVNWGLEATWLIFFFNHHDKTAYFVGLGIMLCLIYVGLKVTKERRYRQASDRIFERATLMNLAWLLGSYLVPPQMALILLPFYALMPQIPLALIYLEGIFNILIIPLWNYAVISLHMDPSIATSPAQWSAAARQAIWLTIYIYLIYPKQTTAFLRRLRKQPPKDTH